MKLYPTYKPQNQPNRLVRAVLIEIDGKWMFFDSNQWKELDEGMSRTFVASGEYVTWTSNQQKSKQSDLFK